MIWIGGHGGHIIPGHEEYDALSIMGSILGEVIIPDKLVIPCFYSNSKLDEIYAWEIMNRMCNTFFVEFMLYHFWEE